MKRSVSHPEDRGHKGCQLAFDFGVKRGYAAACDVKQDRLSPLPFDTPERMAYYRGYQKGYRATHFHRRHPRVDDEYRRQQHGT